MPVRHLIDEDLRWWKIPLLQQLFSPEEIELIQKLPISHTNQDDKLIWKGTASGVFSVKSAYYLQKELAAVHMAEGFDRGQNSEVWRTIWKLPIPNVKKNFFWRACHESLPTRDNLCRRKVINDPKCPICETKVESTFHILWQCQSVKDVWGMGNMKFHKSFLKGLHSFR
jgi:hypothetical protein